jgi:hypothetical protein
VGPKKWLDEWPQHLTTRGAGFWCNSFGATLYRFFLIKMILGNMILQGGANNLVCTWGVTLQKGIYANVLDKRPSLHLFYTHILPVFLLTPAEFAFSVIIEDLCYLSIRGSVSRTKVCLTTNEDTDA